MLRCAVLCCFAEALVSRSQLQSLCVHGAAMLAAVLPCHDINQVSCLLPLPTLLWLQPCGLYFNTSEGGQLAVGWAGPALRCVHTLCSTRCGTYTHTRAVAVFCWRVSPGLGGQLKEGQRRAGGRARPGAVGCLTPVRRLP